MSDKPKGYGALDLAVSKVIAGLVESDPRGLRAIAAAAGMSHNRLGKIAREQTPPPTTGEIDRIALALGTSASAVFAAAEALRASDSDYALAASDSRPDEMGADGGDAATEEHGEP